MHIALNMILPLSLCVARAQVAPLIVVVFLVVGLIIWKAATRPVASEVDAEELLRNLKDTVTPGAP